MLHGIQPQAVGLGAVHLPTGGPAQVIFDVLSVKPRILRQCLGGEAVTWAEPDVPAVRRIAVILGVVGMAHEFDLRVPVTLVGPEIVILEIPGGLLRDVHQIRGAQIPHLPLVVVIADPTPVAVKPVLGHLQVEILGQHPGVQVDRRGRVAAGHLEAAVVHDVVQVDPDPEAVGGGDQPQQVGLRAIESGHAAALILAAQIKRIKQIVAHRAAAAGLGGRWQPERRVPRLCQIGDFRLNLRPARIEILQQRLARGGRRQQQHEEADAARQDGFHDGDGSDNWRGATAAGW